MKNTDDKATVKIVTSFADDDIEIKGNPEEMTITFGSKVCFTFSTDARVIICTGRKGIVHEFGLFFKAYENHYWDKENGILTVRTEENQITVTGLKELNPQFLNQLSATLGKEREEGYTSGFSF